METTEIETFVTNKCKLKGMTPEQLEKDNNVKVERATTMCLPTFSSKSETLIEGIYFKVIGDWRDVRAFRHKYETF